MSDSMSQVKGPVDNSQSTYSSYKVLLDGGVKITSGFWADRQAMNHKVSLKHGFAMLNEAGNLHNLKMAAGLESGSYRGMNFSDETVYKWLEAMAWELGRAPDDELRSLADAVIALVGAAQQPNGYLNSYYQTVEPDRKWADMDFGHELYCAGHLIQAAISFQRAVGDDRLLKIARRFVDHIETIFGPGKREDACGHPEIEMALVELARLTREQRYLHLAQFFCRPARQEKNAGAGSQRTRIPPGSRGCSGCRRSGWTRRAPNVSGCRNCRSLFGIGRAGSARNVSAPVAGYDRRQAVYHRWHRLPL